MGLSLSIQERDKPLWTGWRTKSNDVKECLEVKKRLLASLMCLCLLVGLLPATALAAGATDCPGGDECNHEAAIGNTHYGTLKEAMGAAKNGETVDLLRNVTLTKSVETVRKVSGITLDLNGHNIDGTAVTSSNGVVWMGTKYGWKPVEGTDNTMKIINSVSDQGGEIKGTLPVQFSTGDSRYPIPGEIGEGVTLTVTGDGTDAVQLKSSAYLVYSENSRDYIKNGGFKVTAADGIERIYGSYANAAKAAYNGVVTMLHDYSGKASISSGNRVGVLDLGGNTFTYLNPDKIIEINYDNAGITIQNGTLTANAEVLSEGGVTALYNNTTLVLERVTMNVPGNSYGIVTNGTNTGNTITLKDSTLNVPDGYGIYFPSSGSVTIEDSVINAKYSGVQMCSGSLTVKGDKTAITTTGKPQPKTENDGAIADGAAISVINRSYSGGTPTMSITGGTFSSENAYAVKAYTFNNTNNIEGKWENAKDFVSISGGTFSSDNVTDYLDDGCKLDDTGSVVPSDNSVASIGNKGYRSLKAAITEAKAGDTVTLLKNVTEDVTIPAKTTITLDLNGKTLKNSLEDTITVEYGASLTIQGDGTVDNTSHARAAIYNNGTVVLNGGQYTRSAETGQDAETSGKNSYYNILNHGSMTINNGVTVSQSGGFSSMIANGYYNYTDENPRNGHVEGRNHAKPELVITGGTFSGGLNTVKNDDGAKLTIVDGIFENTKQAAVMNWNEATIKGGSFSVQGSAGSVLVNGSNGANTVDQGVLTIEGGTFTIPGGKPIISINQNGKPAEAKTTVKGGSYSSSVAKYADPNLNFEAKDSNGICTYHSTVEDALDAAGINGTVSTTEKDPNLEITLPTPTKEGYTFLYWEAENGTQYKGGQKVKARVFQDLTAVWKKNSDSSSGSSDNERTYAIITEDNGHGSVTVSADEASAGTRITVTVKPDAGYELDELTVTDAKNKDLKVTKRSETTYTFHMADSKVTVEASFTKDGTIQKPDTRFDDVAKSAWYYKAVEYVAENGIMSGVSAREFAPNAGFSRAMLAQTLYAMSGKPTVKAESIFADVAANAWYADAVNWAAEKGYVSGVGDGKFAPDASVTREQMALILYRYAGSPDASGMAQKEFTDSSSVSAYAVDAIRWAVHEGLISGMENNTLAPQGTATRAQVAQILMNFHQKLDK